MPFRLPSSHRLRTTICFRHNPSPTIQLRFLNSRHKLRVNNQLFHSSKPTSIRVNPTSFRVSPTTKAPLPHFRTRSKRRMLRASHSKVSNNLPLLLQTTFRHRTHHRIRVRSMLEGRSSKRRRMICSLWVLLW